jgi:hypothetical protein
MKGEWKIIHQPKYVSTSRQMTVLFEQCARHRFNSSLCTRAKKLLMIQPKVLYILLLQMAVKKSIMNEGKGVLSQQCEQ